MAKKLIVRDNDDKVWVVNLDPPPSVREISDNDERKTMIKSFVNLLPLIGVQNAILGDDITELDSTGKEKYSR